jgi:hypothetical protein
LRWTKKWKPTGPKRFLTSARMQSAGRTGPPKNKYQSSLFEWRHRREHKKKETLANTRGARERQSRPERNGDLQLNWNVCRQTRRANSSRSSRPDGFDEADNSVTISDCDSGCQAGSPTVHRPTIEIDLERNQSDANFLVGRVVADAPAGSHAGK